MRSNAEFYFQSSVNLLLGVAFLTLASTGKMDAPTILIFAIGYFAYFYRSWKDQPSLLSAKIVNLLTKLYLIVFVIDLVWISKSFVDAALHLLVVIQLFKFYSPKKDRDYFYLIVISFMELLAAAAMTISAAFFFFFIVFLSLVISTLVSFEIKRSQAETEAAPTDVRHRITKGFVPSAEKHGRFSRALAMTSVALCGGTILIAGFIFFGLPRVEGGFFTRASAPTQVITGFSTAVQFGDVGAIKKNLAVVMRVEIEGDPKEFVGVKWRGIALNSFEGNSWYRILGREPVVLPRVREGLLEYYSVPGGETPSRHHLVQYKVILEPLSTEVLFVASHARSITAQARVRMDAADSFFTDYHPVSRLRYAVFSDIGSPRAEDLRQASGEYPPDVRQHYLGLPALDPRIPALAESITRSARNNYDRAADIEHYLRDKYGYTLDLPSVREKDPLSEFLFVRRRGHCEYFSSSMAVLLRTLGIPSRVVNGFQTGEYNPLGHDFIVREADAHSWVEAYFPDYGWISFDPTPPSGPVDENSAWIALTHYLDALELFWINWVVGYDSIRQVTLFQDLQHRTVLAKEWITRAWLKIYATVTGYMQRAFFSPQEGRGRWSGGRNYSTLLSWLLVLILVGSGLFLGFRQWRAYRLGRFPVNKMATEAIQRWFRAVARRGYKRLPSQTPMEFSLSIPHPGLRSLSVDITSDYNSLRFDPTSMQLRTYTQFQAKLQSALKRLSSREWK